MRLWDDESFNTLSGRNEVCMNNPTSNDKASKPSKSIKPSDRVEAQLARPKKSKGEVVTETLTAPLPEMEIIPVSTLPPVERLHLVEAETAEPVEIVPNSQLRKVEQVDRKMLGKVKRAFLKAGVVADPEAQAAFLNDLLMADIPVVSRSSGRIARVLKGEKSIESLLPARVPTKSA
jgi:hypothetical protein